MTYVTREQCRACDGQLQEILNLGEIYPSNFIEGYAGAFKAPLCLSRCERCGLVQLRDTVNLDLMYRQYWYQSGLNPAMVRALADVAQQVTMRVNLQAGDQVVDIGCNDGTLLAAYSTPDLVKIGFDPAHNLAEPAQAHCQIFVNDYFSAEAYFQHTAAPAKVVTAIAMFYDLEDPGRFVEDVRAVLAPDGLWVLQFTDLASMFSANAFDNICHEHLEYYSLNWLFYFLLKHRLQIVDVATNAVNGGSLRAYVRHFDSAFPVQPSVWRALDAENRALNVGEDSFQAFADRVRAIRQAVRKAVSQMATYGWVVDVLGASTKGNTLLQYYGIDHHIVRWAAEINPEKFGRYTIGSNIKIVPEDYSLAHAPDVYLCLPWHFKETFLQKFASYIESGGDLFFPLPEPHGVTQKGTYQTPWKTLLGKV